MTLEDLSEFFEEHEDEFLKFDRIGDKFSTRPDLHAFILLDDLLENVPFSRGEDDIIGSAEHDEIYLSVDVEKLLTVISEDELIDLHRCGVRYDEQYDTLCMFV